MTSLHKFESLEEMDITYIENTTYQKWLKEV